MVGPVNLHTTPDHDEQHREVDPVKPANRQRVFMNNAFHEEKVVKAVSESPILYNEQSVSVDCWRSILASNRLFKKLLFAIYLNPQVFASDTTFAG